MISTQYSNTGVSPRLQVVHYDKTRVSEGSRVRSQIASSEPYADSFLVLSALKDEPWEPHWAPEVLVKMFVAGRSTPRRFVQECAAGLWLADQARKGRFDVLHAHHNTALIVALAWIIFCRKPVIFDTHDLFSPDVISSRSYIRRICSWLKWNLLQRFLLSRAQAAVHVSPGIVRTYQSLFPKTRHYLLWNLPAFALKRTPEAKASHAFLPEVRASTQRPLRLVYFGLLTSQRISLPLIRTVASIPGVELNLFGRIYDETDDFESYSTEFKKVLQELQVPWKGSYKTSELPGILAEMDMLIHPIPVNSENNKHALPNKLFESCYNGLAILYSNIFRDLDDLATRNGFGCSFDPCREDSIRNVIGTLVSDRQRVSEMQYNARKFVETGDWSTVAYHSSLRRIYEQACPARFEGGKL